MTVIACIPARGGSKGVPYKNIRPLANKPLIAHSILDAKEAHLQVGNGVVQLINFDRYKFR